MNILTPLEILVVVSTTLQIFVTLFCVFAYYFLHKNYRGPWFWLLISFTLVIGRRILGTARLCDAVSTIEIEYIMTCITTCCWGMFIYKSLTDSTKNLDKTGDKVKKV
jgi:hypothetical protein